MSELQDTINQILSDPEAMRQVQSLGEQLGLTNAKPPPPKPAAENGMASALTSLAPLMQGMTADDDLSRLLDALRPFLSSERLERLNQAKRLMRLVQMIPLIKESGLLF